MRYRMWVDPRARGAYFDALGEVSRAEFEACVPGYAVQVSSSSHGTWLEFEAEEIPKVIGRLSTFQTCFECGQDGWIRPVELPSVFGLPDSWVWGARYRGKTHELLTQLAINLARSACAVETPEHTWKVFDPMAGRGTTLLWSMRYGMDSCGIEIDPKALDDLQRHIGRQTKVHRIKHQRTRSAGRRAAPAVEVAVEGTRLRLMTGDSARSGRLVGQERFHLLVTDIPYGIQHRGGRDGQRSPLTTLESCAASWSERLLPGAGVAIAFNTHMPTREQLAGVMASVGLRPLPIALPHRMSESIIRDVAVFRKDG